MPKPPKSYDFYALNHIAAQYYALFESLKGGGVRYVVKMLTGYKDELDDYGEAESLQDEVLDEVLSWEKPITYILKKQAQQLKQSPKPKLLAFAMAGILEGVPSTFTQPGKWLVKHTPLVLNSIPYFAKNGEKGMLVVEMVKRLDRLVNAQTAP